MAADEHDVRIERRLRLGIRLVFYPLCVGLIALVWSHQRHGAVTQAAAQPEQARVTWLSGATEQGEGVQASIVDGALASFETRVVTHCLDGTPWTLRLTMSGGEIQQTGDVVTGQQGPNMTISDQGERVLITTRLRAELGREPAGTIVSDITRRPGLGSVQCNSYELTYKLRRATDPPPDDERHEPRLTSLRCSVLSGVRRDDLGCRRLPLGGLIVP